MKKRYYIDEAKPEKIILLDREMTKMEASLEVDTIESLRKEKRRQEDQAKSITAQDEEIRLQYNWGKAILIFIKEVVETNMARREEGKVQNDDKDKGDENKRSFLWNISF